MMYDLPCSCCCKHLTIPDEVWVKGGIVTCKFCGYRTKIQAHKVSPIANPDDVLLKRKTPKRSFDPPVDPSAIGKKSNNPLTPIYTWYGKLNPKPYVDVKLIKDKPAVEVGLKFEF